MGREPRFLINQTSEFLTNQPSEFLKQIKGVEGVHFTLYGSKFVGLLNFHTEIPT